MPLGSPSRVSSAAELGRDDVELDAQDGHRGVGTKAEHNKAGAGRQDLSLLLRNLTIDRPTRYSGRHHVSPPPISRGQLFRRKERDSLLIALSASRTPRVALAPITIAAIP
jgi:hypothetical protein